MQPLLDYIKNPECAIANEALANSYFSLKQYPAALSFYLRAADRGDTDTAYRCLLRVSDCLSKQGRRDSSVIALYKRAIALDPSNPEAYIRLSRHYESKKLWLDSYLISKLGLNKTNNVYCKFQAAVSSWWTGYYSESRALFRDLAFNCWYDLDETHQKVVERNLQRLGSGPESQAFHYYNSKKHSLRFSFNGSEHITQNYSQCFQDLFVLTALNGKTDGIFLEVGGADPFKGNNTALLEQLGWTGISIEIDKQFTESYKQKRPKTRVINDDATTLNYNKLLATYTHIDYLQLDIEPSRNTFEASLSIPFHNTTFGVITYEHDHYIDRTQSYRDKSRRYLQSLGYILLVENISPDKHSPFEDWYVHPDYVSRETIATLQHSSDVTYCVDYFLR
jgi:tetratricopeptide (TPR) repeat protein